VTCAAFADLLVDLARESPMEPAVRASALGHAATCRECGERLTEQRMLSAGLSELAASDNGRAAPPWIETSLRARLRATQRPAAQSKRPLRWAWTSVVAASAVLAAMSLLTARSGSVTLPHATPAPAAAAADDGSFVALPYGDSLADLDAVQVVRVQVQPAALASLGWTVGSEAGSPVEAELLVGQDGIARGIRFVE